MKVGGTTISLVLERIAMKMGWKFCCNQPGDARLCDICAGHGAQRCLFDCLGTHPPPHAPSPLQKCENALQNQNIGPYDPERTKMIVNFRKPIERYLSQLYFSALGRIDKEIIAKGTHGEKLDLKVTDEFFRRNGPRWPYFPGKNLTFLDRLDIIGITEKTDEFMADSFSTFFFRNFKKKKRRGKSATFHHPKN